MKQYLATALLLFAVTGAGSADEAATNKTLDLDGLTGKWLGRSDDGRFEEAVTYRWNADHTYLEVEAAFRTDGNLTGTGTGYMLIDDATETLRFSIVASQGTVIHQQQISGDSESVEMEATAVNPGRVGMPPVFRTRIHIYDENHYWTELLVHEEGEWVTAMQNEFERQE